MAPAKKAKGAPPPATERIRHKKGGHSNKAENAVKHRAAQQAARKLLNIDKPLAKRKPDGHPVTAPSVNRPVEYDEEVARKVCLMFATDTKMTLGRLDNDPTLPTAMTIYDWLRTRPDFERFYARARDLQFDKQAEELAEIAARPLVGTVTVERSGGKDGDTTEVRTHDNVDRARLLVDTRKWLLSKQRPKKYGVQPIEVGDGNAPLQELLNQFRARSKEIEDAS